MLPFLHAPRRAKAMIRIPPFATLAASAILLVLLLPLAAQGDHHEKSGSDWDQAKVTALAEQLSDSVNDVYRSVSRLQTGSGMASGQANAFLRLKDRLRVARNEARHLAQALGDGKGHEETSHAYRRLMSLVRDAREEGRKMFLEKPTLDKVETANKLLEEIAPFYPEIASSPPAS
jgi:hypothetical protein